MKKENLIISLLCFAVGLLGLYGVIFERAMHHAMTSGVCIIFGVLYLVEYIQERNRANKLNNAVAKLAKFASACSEKHKSEQPKDYKAPKAEMQEVKAEEGIAVSGNDRG